MPEYKKQHYLPVAYLKYFSEVQGRCNRQSWVWRCDGNEQRRVPVVSQCAGDYHYSKMSPAKAEESFHPSEKAYCQCLDNIRSGQEPSERNLGNLLLFMFDLNLRNKVHENRTGAEGIVAYNMRSTLFLYEIIGARSGQDTKQVGRSISARWSLRILSPPPEREFITSDHPSVWMSLNHTTPTLHLVTLPLTPRRVAIAFDMRFVYMISQQMTDRDYGLLSFGRVHNFNKCLYASKPFTEMDMATMRKARNQNASTLSEVTERGWRFSIVGLPSESYFSFMRLKPPLL